MRDCHNWEGCIFTSGFGDKAADEGYKQLLTAAKEYSDARRMPEALMYLRCNETLGCWGNWAGQKKDDNVYTRGSELSPPDHDLVSNLIVRIVSLVN